MRKFLKKGLRHDVEDKKISQRVFDRSTLLTLYELARKGKIGELGGIISTGKEANIFYGVRDKKEIAIKIYCIETSDFRKVEKYIRGDPRFKVGRNRRQIVYQLAHKEFKNLSMVYQKISAPEPIAVLNNVIVLEFIGKNRIPAPKLKDAPCEKPKKYFDAIIKDMRTMYCIGLVHGDLSEYNILNHGKPVFIDFSMGVVLEHPLSLELLKRDIRNIVKYFNKCGLDEDPSEVLKRVTK